MNVHDYDLLNNIDMLYEASIIIYGAGYMGSKVLKILQCMETDISYFCDADRSKTEYYGYKVVNIEDIAKTCELGGVYYYNS